jgi:hypothetical protein
VCDQAGTSGQPAENSVRVVLRRAMCSAHQSNACSPFPKATFSISEIRFMGTSIVFQTIFFALDLQLLADDLDLCLDQLPVLGLFDRELLLQFSDPPLVGVKTFL